MDTYVLYKNLGISDEMFWHTNVVDLYRTYQGLEAIKAWSANPKYLN